MLSPAALSTVVRVFDGDERNRALGIWSALGGGGAALGVLLGGLITAGPGWPWVFFINLPVGVVVSALLARLLPALPASESAGGRVDIVGAVLVAAASGAAVFALVRAGNDGWAAGIVIGLSVAGAGLGVMFVVSSATALGAVAPHEAGVASGLLSTFHEFGTAAGAAIVSSVAAASLTAQTVIGFQDAFLVCAIGAGAGAVLLTGLAPGTTASTRHG